MSCSQLNQQIDKGMIAHLGIKIVEIGADYLSGQMEVTKELLQPFGKLHGGASCCLAETVASVAANLCLAPGQIAVGQNLNSHHLVPVAIGTLLTAITKPIRLGKSSQVWQIEIQNTKKEIINQSTLTVAIRPHHATHSKP